MGWWKRESRKRAERRGDAGDVREVITTSEHQTVQAALAWEQQEDSREPGGCPGTRN